MRGNEEVERLATIIRLNHPEAIFQKGYSITRVNGKIVKGIREVQPGDEILTQFVDGTATSTIQKINMPHE